MITSKDQKQESLNSGLLGNDNNTPNQFERPQISARRSTIQAKPGIGGFANQSLFNKSATKAFQHHEPQEEAAISEREIHIEPTKWQAIKLFFMNTIEIMLLIVAFVYSVFNDDLNSLAFELFTILLLYLSMKDMGKYVPLQRKLTLGALIFVFSLLVVKWLVMDYLEDGINANYDSWHERLVTFGYKFNFETIQDESGKQTQEISFSQYRSVEFEFFTALILAAQFYYYNDQYDRIAYSRPFGYIHHSLWLKQHFTPFYIMFFLLAFDTFFAQTIFQFIVLVTMIFLMYIWAFGYKHRTKISNSAVTILRWMYTIQLISFGFTEIVLINEALQSIPWLYDTFFVLGLILKIKPYYASLSHVLIISATLCFNQLYETSYNNYLQLGEVKKSVHKPNVIKGLTKSLMGSQKKQHQQQLSKNLLSVAIGQASNKTASEKVNQATLFQSNLLKDKMAKGFQKTEGFDFNKFMRSYAPYVFIWVCRISMVVIAYFYHGYQGILIITWILLSFVFYLVDYVKWTIFIVNPFLTFLLLFTYFINIPGIFLDKNAQIQGNTGIFNYFIHFIFPPIEIGFFMFTLTFFILLIPSQPILIELRDEFRITLFQTLSDKNRNFLFQLSFYIIKRLHIVVLLLLFFLTMKEITIYYIGLMFFFIMFASSLTTYRVYGRWLVAYAGFFIWLVYLWSLIHLFFDPKQFFYKFMIMLTFTYEKPDQTGVNEYFQVAIPVGNWITLMVFVVLTNINSFFRKDKKIVKKSFGNEEKKSTQKQEEFNSTGEYFEAKVDYVLRKKFPTTARLINMFTFIVSEMMIVFILLAQALILALQSATLFLWGFLVFSLTLQTSIVSSLQISVKLYRRCKLYSRLLKYYSLTIIIAQVSFHFITNRNFLAQYGWDDVLFDFIGEFANYLPLIGLETFNANTNPLSTFVSQIAFYIMATILEDYFQDKLQRLENQDDEPGKQTSLRLLSPDNKQSTLGRGNFDEQFEDEDEVSQIRYNFEQVRFRISYMIYEKMHWWRFIDTVALYFYLVTASAIVYFCVFWQISLLMAFFLICAVVQCLRAAQALYNNGNQMTKEEVDIQYTKPEEVNRKFMINSSKVLTLEQAHHLNREYMENASYTLLQVRKRQWTYQYWILIIAILIIYPASTLPIFQAKLPQYATEFNKVTFWLYWCGLNVVETNLASKVPVYTILVLLILEKLAQRWMNNRFGCTTIMIKLYKTIDEQMKLINQNKSHNPDKEDNETEKFNNPYSQSRIIADSILIQQKKEQDKSLIQRRISDFVTIGAAEEECRIIANSYNEETEVRKEIQLKQKIMLELKRKYTIQFRTAQKIIVEQLSLLLLLLSCSYKANLISILYLGILFTFLRIKDKTKGMLIITYTFGLMVTLEYIAALTNLSSLNSPSRMPIQYRPYPSLENPHGEYIFPWFLKVDFLRNNLDWAVFFGLDIERGAIVDILFDFVNLVVLTVYFFNYGNPINANNIKVSFSRTTSLEKNLQDYSQSMMRKKALSKINIDVIKEENYPDDNKQDSLSQQAADDSQEYFLGATYYLNILKNEIFIYSFITKSRYVIFLGSQIVTLTLIFVIAILSTSFFSLGYMIACVPLIIGIADYFNIEQIHQENKTWKHPYYISGILMIYSFIDIALQICYQLPSQEPSQLQSWFGLGKIYDVKQINSYSQMLKYNGAIAVQNSENLKLLILKCFNMFFIFLQSRIYESEGFLKFTRQERRSLTNIAQKDKKFATTYRFNNWKLQQIVKLQETKSLLYQGVAELKVKLQMWSNLIKGAGLITNAQTTAGQLQQQQLVEQQDPVTTPNQSLKAGNRSTLLSREPSKEVTFADNEEEQFKQSPTKISIRDKLIKSMVKIDIQDVEKKLIFKQRKSDLPMLARFYLYIQKKKVDQILFINELDQIAKISQDMQKGKRSIYCDLEYIMQKDIKRRYQVLNQHQHKGKDSPFKKTPKKTPKKGKIDVRLADMEGTQKFIATGSILQSLIIALSQAAFCNSAFFAYLFMIISQIVNGGIISIIYPFAIFGYALMEEARPPKAFWNFMLKYTLFILFAKFICQLDVWVFILEDNPEASSLLIYYNSWLQFGLWRVQGISNMLFYVLSEIMILFAIMCQIYYEILIGLHAKREVEIENIQEAKIRFLNAISGAYIRTGRTVVQNQAKGILVEEDDFAEDSALTLDERILQYKYDIQQQKAEFDKLYRPDNEDSGVLEQYKELRRQEFEQDAAEYLHQKNLSFIDDQELRHDAAKILKAKRKFGNPLNLVKKYFGHRPYFKELFPIIKEQKPGVDLYAWTTFVQFVICIYILNAYTQMDAVGTQNLENTSQFSFHMVIVLFFQVFIMVAERYINRTNIRVKVKKVGDNKKDNIDTEDRMFQKMQMLDAPRSMSIHIKALKTGDTMLDNAMSKKSTLNALNETAPDITLSQTRITHQQISKYIIQWGLLIIYHLAIFWYFPLYSNYAIYGSPECNPSSRAYQSYGCFNFHANGVVIVFYILCCSYFTASALQIQYGLPDYRRGSILMAKHDLRHQLTYQIFYNIPFAMELKTTLDWCFTKTSLDVNQWLELVHINSELFFAKCSNRSYFQRKLGTVIDQFEKYLCGCFCLGVIFFFLLGPFLMFSNLSYIAAENLITQASMDMKIQISNGYNGESYLFPLFESKSAIYIQPMPEEEFINKSFNIQPETKFFEYSQAQVIKMKNSSEIEWQLSGDQKEIYDNLIKMAYNGDTNIDVQIKLGLYFERPGPLTAKTSQKQIIKVLQPNNTQDHLLIKQFDMATDLKCEENENATQEITIPSFLATHLRFTEQEKFSALINEDTMPLEDLELIYSCGDYWSLNIDGERVTFTTFSDLISSGFLSATSIMGFYLGVAYLVGTTLRKIVVYNSDRIFICDMPNPDALLNLCDCIYLYRLEQNLKKEEELYFVLLECLRSPEMLKAIAGSSLRTQE